MHLIAAICTVAAVGVLAAGGWLCARDRKYCGYLKYNPRKDCKTQLSGPLVRTVAVRCTSRGLLIPESAGTPASAFLEIEVHSSLLGRFADPAVALTACNFSDSQFFERGASGMRNLNLSRLLASAGLGCDVHLRGRHMTWPEQESAIHLCNERPDTDDRVLVVAPHPDDAEIA